MWYFREQVLGIVRQYPGVAEQVKDSNDKIYDCVLEDRNLYVSWFSTGLTKKGGSAYTSSLGSLVRNNENVDCKCGHCYGSNPQNDVERSAKLYERVRYSKEQTV
jgi:hypothetical protein